MDKIIATKTQTMTLLMKYDLKAKKKFGQNFLIEEKISDKITSAVNIDQNTIVIEIGPGLGALTQKLATKAKKVIAYEIDSDLVKVLRNELGYLSNLEVVEEDFLKVDLVNLIKTHKIDGVSFVIVSNLPYYITSEIITSLCLLNLQVIPLVVMMQKEVATKILKKHNEVLENELTIFSSYFYDVSLLTQVSKNAFIPRPNVDSSVLVYLPKNSKELSVDEEKNFILIIDILYKQRRKTIYNNLRNHFDEKMAKLILDEAKIEPNLRVDELKIDSLVEIAKIITQINHQI